MNTNKFIIVSTVLLWVTGFGYIYAQPGTQIINHIHQDSVEFHQFLISQNDSRGINTNNSNNGLQLAATTSAATYSGSFTLEGNANTYYPVAFEDGGWAYHEATVLNLGRSNVHENEDWHGSMIAQLRFHTFQWGSGSQFIDADIKQYHGLGFAPFIAGWQDATGSNNSLQIIIWLRGLTTYHYHCNYLQNPVFTNGPLTVGTNTYPVKTQLDDYVNSYGRSFTNPKVSFSGDVGIGTANPTHKLDVRGTIRANEVLVNSAGADFVFAKDYRLRPLTEVEQFITTNRHLPDIAPADSMVQNGVNMGEMQIKLLQKIEELTLYAIEQGKKIDEQSSKIEMQQKEIEELKNK